MIILLGASGYVGQAFQKELTRRQVKFLPLSRKDVDYTRADVLLKILKENKPQFLINAAGYTGKPNVDACEDAWADTLLGNAVLPATISAVCTSLSIPWGQVSSGCIFTGAKIEDKGKVRIEKDLTKPELQKIIKADPTIVKGFTEDDEPNFSFRNKPCSFYSGSKALGEEALKNDNFVYIWRLRIPFNNIANPRNFLVKLQSYPKVYDNLNSLSHLDEYVGACLDLWQKKAPFGTYNVTNGGFVSSAFVVERIKEILKPSREFVFWKNDEEFYSQAAKTPRSNCVLDNSKLLRAGVKMRPVEEAVEESLVSWGK